MTKSDRQARVLAINEELRNALGQAKSENRALTSEENTRMDALRNERAELMEEIELERSTRVLESMKVNDNEVRSAIEFANAVIESMNTRKPIEVRSAIDYSGAEPVIPVSIGDIIAPLEKGMIFDKVGCKVQTGLKGDWKYPVVAAIEASVAGETASVSDTTLTLSKVTASPRRCSLSVAVSNNALNGGDPELKGIVLAQLTEGLKRLINKWMFQEAAIASGVYGVFHGSNIETKTYAHNGHPSYADIMGLKGAVDANGVAQDGTAAFIMSAAMKAYLEATPKTATYGDRMICENGMINGIPVFTSEYVGSGYIKFGYFSYALVGIFGDPAILVDPYTLATTNQVRFVINAGIDIKAARQEAFGVLCEADS